MSEEKVLLLGVTYGFSIGGACVMAVLFGLFGIKFGRLSKSIKKSPCSPHPPVGVAVAKDAGNGLLALD